MLVLGTKQLSQRKKLPTLTTGLRQLWRECWRSKTLPSFCAILFGMLLLNVLLLYIRCILDGRYQQAMGMAIECRRLDKLEEAVMRSDNAPGSLSYCIKVSHSYVNRREYRQEVRSFSCLSYKLELQLFRQCFILLLVSSYALHGTVT